MSKLLSLVIVFAFPVLLVAQKGSNITQSPDSGAQFYISPFFGFYTGNGTFAQRATPDIEFGLQWQVFSVGLDLGKTSLGQGLGGDTTTYLEIRPNLNVFQQGNFTNTLTIGLGYVFGAKQNIMTEFTTGIEYTPNEKLSYNIFFGTYYFSGVESSSSNNFFGASIMYYFLKNKPKLQKGFFNN